MILLPLIIWLYAFKGFDLTTVFRYTVITHYIIAGLFTIHFTILKVRKIKA